MQKGTMMTGIVDAYGVIASISEKALKKCRSEGLFTDKEAAYINTVFAEMLKDGNNSLEQVKKFLSPKQLMDEGEKLKQLEIMYLTMKAHEAVTEKFEKGFAELSTVRLSRHEDISEVEQLFKLRTRKAKK